MTQESCSHQHTHHEFQTREFEGESFKYKALICKDCGTNLWDAKTEEKFNQWLNTQYESLNRNKFQVQFHMSERALSCLDKLLERFPGVERSYLMRALITVYMDIVSVDDMFAELANGLENSEEYKSLQFDEKLKYKLQFKPKALMEIRALSDITGEKPSKVIEEILTRMISICIKSDPKIRSYWENLIYKNLEIILKAA